MGCRIDRLINFLLKILLSSLSGRLLPWGTARICSTSFLRPSSACRTSPFGKICCDNQTALKHDDLLHALHTLHSKLGPPFTHEHVYGHQDKFKLWHQLWAMCPVPVGIPDSSSRIVASQYILPEPWFTVTVTLLRFHITVMLLILHRN